MSPEGRSGESADRGSSHWVEVRHAVLPCRLLNVSCTFRTGRRRGTRPTHLKGRDVPDTVNSTFMSGRPHSLHWRH